MISKVILQVKLSDHVHQSRLNKALWMACGAVIWMQRCRCALKTGNVACFKHSQGPERPRYIQQTVHTQTVETHSRIISGQCHSTWHDVTKQRAWTALLIEPCHDCNQLITHSKTGCWPVVVLDMNVSSLSHTVKIKVLLKSNSHTITLHTQLSVEMKICCYVNTVKETTKAR